MAQEIDDSVNRKIIQLLNENGRRSFTELANLVGISEAAARQRVNKLVNSEAIKISAIPDAKALGFHRKALIGIRHQGSMGPLAKKMRTCPKFPKWLLQLENLMYCWRLFAKMTNTLSGL